MRTREEHLEFCKTRALEYVERGQLANAVASMGSDLKNHPETRAAPELIFLGIMKASEGDRQGVINWIKGFR